MIEKLRLVLPANGRLANKKNWNVYSVLEAAGIGKRRGDDKHIDFEPSIEGIEIRIKKPRDIPRALYMGSNYGHPNICGITGRDLVIENERDSNVSFTDSKVIELCDLKCGYVDLVFATKRERWERASNDEETIAWVKKMRAELSHDEFNGQAPLGLQMLIGAEEDLGKRQFECPSKLETFMFYTQKERDRNARVKCKPIFCGTEYPNLGKISWVTLINSRLAHRWMKVNIDEIVKGKAVGLPGIELISSHGVTEELLDEGADLILENMATGESLAKRDCVALESCFSSTARLYASQECNYEKLTELAERINAVVKDIENYCQINVYLNDHSAKQALYDCFSKFDDKKAGHVLIKNLKPNNDDTIRGYLVLHKKNLAEAVNLLGRDSLFNSLEAWNLSSLYAYCSTIRIGDKLGIYPPAFNALRPEHRQDALIFSTDKNETYVNPKYKTLLDNSGIVQ